jgi:hypothetical protein
MSDTEKVIATQRFYGGQSSDDAVGPNASFSYSRALDHRSKPSQLSVLPGPRQLSQGVVADLILKMEQVASGLRYGYGDAGNIYKINNNVITFVNKLSTGSDGMLYRSDTDALYFATQTDVQRYYPISGTPTFDVTYGPSKSIDTAAYRTGGAQTYTVPVAIDENQQCAFQPDIEPFYSNKVKVVTKGTGTLTITLHDGLNNVLATKTLANNDTSFVLGMTEFVYSAQVRALVKPNARTYHFHVTSSVADTSIQCATAGLLSTADFELWAYRLVDTINNLHPMAQFLQYILIGNGNYLAVWEPLSDRDPPNSEFQRHRLVFPPGFEVCGIDVTDEFAVIACAKYSTDATKDFQEGKLFIWDGFGTTYNQIIDVSSGAPEGLKTHENVPYFVANGVLRAWGGGKRTTKVRTLRGTQTVFSNVVDSTRLYPNMLTVRDDMLHVGYPSTSNNVNIEYGVYIWGSLDKDYDPSFNYGYVNSTQVNSNTSGNLRHGCIANFGDEMYISVQYADGTYGLEIVDNLCKPAPIFSFRTRRFDAGRADRNKLLNRTEIYTAALPTGTTITPVYQIDDNTVTVMTDTAFVMGAGATSVNAKIQEGQFKRALVGFNGTCTAATPTAPVIYVDSMVWDPMAGRRP